jgi:capsular polysaccharide biosynthesis protein
MSEQSFNTISDDEISIKDIIDFLIESWKVILLTGLLGLIGAIAYLWVTPNQYQATMQIKIGQTSNLLTNIRGANIEEQNSLMARLKLPTNYSAKEIKACNLSAEAIATSAKFSLVKDVDSLIELKINRNSKEIAIACADALYENIKTTQNEIIKPHIKEAEALIVIYQDRLNNLKSLVYRVDLSADVFSVVYLANRDEIKFLTDEILRLKSFIASVDIRQAKLVVPIYASDEPVLPKRKINLMAGLMIGLFLGLLFVVGKKALER